MVKRVSVDYLDTVREMALDVATSYAKSLPGMRECDIRIEVDEGKGASVENGAVRRSGDDYGFSMGVHVLAGDGALASGYVGKQLGVADTRRFDAVLKEAVDFKVHIWELNWVAPVRSKCE